MVTMQEHVAKRLCEEAGKSVNKKYCTCVNENTGELECLFWETFMDEAKAAIEAVRDFNLLTPRKKPRLK
jgi:hypothetical protein